VGDICDYNDKFTVIATEIINLKSFDHYGQRLLKQIWPFTIWH